MTASFNEQILSCEPKISVIMSVHNAQNYLPNAIDSILDQSYKNFEFIIVNDGSSDDSLSIIQDYASLDARIICVDQSNIGLTKSLIKAINLSSGVYIARMDADDISDLSRLFHQVQILNKNNLIGLVGTWATVIDQENNELKKSKLLTSSKRIMNKIKYGNQFIHGSMMFRRNIYFECGGYDESFKYSQDYDLWLRMIKLTKPFNIDKYLYKLRIHHESISSLNQSTQFQNAVKAITKNICHAKLQKYSFFANSDCDCFACNPKNKSIPNDTVNIVSARLHLRMGDYKNARIFYKKVNSFESIFMSTIIRFEGVAKSLKSIYSYSIK